MAELLMVAPKELVANDRNVRMDIETDEEMLASIRSMGVLTPLLARRLDDGTLLLTAGHRRLHHVLALGRQAPKRIPVMVGDPVKDDDADQTDTTVMLVENIHRKDLSAVEEARAFKEMVDLGMTQAAVADAVGVTTSRVSRRLGLLKLPTEALDEIHAGTVTLEQAENWLRLKNQLVIAEAYRGRWDTWKVNQSLANAERAKRIEKAQKLVEATGVPFSPEMPGWNAMVDPTDPSKGRYVRLFESTTVNFDEHGVPIPDGEDIPVARTEVVEGTYLRSCRADDKAAIEALAATDGVALIAAGSDEGKTLYAYGIEPVEVDTTSSVDAERKAEAERRKAEHAHRLEFFQQVVAGKHKPTDIARWAMRAYVGNAMDNGDLFDDAAELLQLDPAPDEPGAEPSMWGAMTQAFLEAGGDRVPVHLHRDDGAAYLRCVLALVAADVQTSMQWHSSSRFTEDLLSEWGFTPLFPPDTDDEPEASTDDAVEDQGDAEGEG